MSHDYLPDAPTKRRGTRVIFVPDDYAAPCDLGWRTREGQIKLDTGATPVAGVIWTLDPQDEITTIPAPAA